MNKEIIIEAIKNRQIVEFFYKGSARTVEPYVVGKTNKGKVTLLSIQTGGHSPSGNLPAWRMFEIDLMENIHVYNRKFAPYFEVFPTNQNNEQNIYNSISKVLGLDQEFSRDLYNKFEELIQYKNNKTYWLARDLQKLFGYSSWQYFSKVIEKAEILAEENAQEVKEHFIYYNEKLLDFLLTPYACLLIAQNSDLRKKEIIFACTYFAEKLRLT